jgi:Iap family predicted aminopeptidase
MAAAAAALIAAGGVGWGLAGHDNSNQPVASPPSTSSVPLKLTLGSGAEGKCRAVEVGDIRRMQVAFEGTATAVNGELVTLHVDHWYHGGTASTVEVQSDADAVAALLGVEFKAGESYLVTATNNQVSTCGESAPSNPALRTLYQQAFPN